MGIDCVIQHSQKQLAAGQATLFDACPWCKLFLAVLGDAVNDHDHDCYSAILS